MTPCHPFFLFLFFFSLPQISIHWSGRADRGRCSRRPLQPAAAAPTATRHAAARAPEISPAAHPPATCHSIFALCCGGNAGGTHHVRARVGALGRRQGSEGANEQQQRARHGPHGRWARGIVRRRGAPPAHRGPPRGPGFKTKQNPVCCHPSARAPAPFYAPARVPAPPAGALRPSASGGAPPAAGIAAIQPH